jgi:hypothetical protein
MDISRMRNVLVEIREVCGTRGERYGCEWMIWGLEGEEGSVAGHVEEERGKSEG